MPFDGIPLWASPVPGQCVFLPTPIAFNNASDVIESGMEQGLRGHMFPHQAVFSNESEEAGVLGHRVSIKVAFHHENVLEVRVVKYSATLGGLRIDWIF